MSTAPATAPSPLADQATVPELINDIVSKYKQVKDRLEGADRRTIDLANTDYLRLQDLQTCIETHPGQWSDENKIKEPLRCLKTECDNGVNEKNVSLKYTYIDLYRVSVTQYRKEAEDQLEKEAKDWLNDRREAEDRADSDKDLYETSMSGLPTNKIMMASGP